MHNTESISFCCRSSWALIGTLVVSSVVAGEPRGGQYAPVVDAIERLARTEIEAGTIPGVSVALVDGDSLVWAGGFGWADVEEKVPATQFTVHRVGSISKLFTALGVLVLVEQGKLDLDAPITEYYPEYRIAKSRFPEAKPTTLRQLMTHRAGIPRESPVGSYFDGTEPGLERTVRSLNGCELVYEPETRTKYSNVGVSVEGYVASRVIGKEFEVFEEQAVLRPLGMFSSSFRLEPRLREKLAKPYLRLADGRETVSPVFELGTIPAGNLYSTVEDMARFIVFLHGEGVIANGRIVRAETLREMYRVQFADEGQKAGFGLAFARGELDGHTWIGHGGAVYGFASQLMVLPDEKLGVMVCINKDIANGVSGSLARLALQWMLAVRKGESGPPAPTFLSAHPDWTKELEGPFYGPKGWFEVSRRDGRLVAHWMGHVLDLRPVGTRQCLAYGDSFYATPVGLSSDGSEITFSGATYTRTTVKERDKKGDPRWSDYLGTYGFPYIPAVIHVRYGKLYARLENAFEYEAIPDGDDAFIFESGMYFGERLVFLRDSSGKVDRMRLGPVEFERTSP